MAKKDDRPDWATIRRAWQRSREPVAALARRHGVPSSTLRTRAKRENWPPRPAAGPAATAPDDCLASALLLYEDLSRSLREAIVALRAPLDDDPGEARGRAGLIRDHRKALAAVLDAQTPLKEADAKPAAFEFDRDAARREFRHRLDRLMADRGAGGLS